MPSGFPNNGLNSGWIKKGDKLSDETRKRMKEAFKGRVYSKERNRKISASRKGFKMSEEQKEKIRKSLQGKKQTRETIEKRVVHFKGKKSHFWKGGITPSMIQIRNSFNYKLWRKAVFERDNWTCVWCNKRGGYLEVDHIIPFSKIIEKLKFEQGIDNLYEKAMDYELLWDTCNGRTLCRECHRIIGWRGSHIKGQLGN